MIYQLSEGNILKRKEIEQNFGIIDFLKWNLYKQHDYALEEEMREIIAKENKAKQKEE